MDVMSDLTLNDYASGFDLAARRVMAIATEVSEHIATDDLDAASLVLGTQQGKLAELHECWGDLLERLLDAGADWKRAVRTDG